MKRPSFQFYPGDWLNDASLRMVSVGARGLWIDMLCIMHQGSEYGYLKVNGKVILPPNLARMTGTTFKELEGYLDELESAGVFSRDDEGCIFSRRMIRDEKIRESRAAGGSKGGNPNLKVRGEVNLQPNLELTPSSSSSSSKKHLSSVSSDDSFDRFWAAWPSTDRKTAKAKCAEKWLKADLSELADTIVDHVERSKLMNRQWRDGFEPAPLTYLNQRRWEDGGEGDSDSSIHNPFPLAI